MKIINFIPIRPVLSENSIRRRATLDVVRRVFESAGTEFIDENGGGPGVRLRKRQRPKQPN
jgi:hypothetical protein